MLTIEPTLVDVEVETDTSSSPPPPITDASTVSFEEAWDSFHQHLTMVSKNPAHKFDDGLTIEEKIAILQGAKLNLITYGWRRGSMGSIHAGFCVRGAARQAAGELGIYYGMKVDELISKELYKNIPVDRKNPFSKSHSCSDPIVSVTRYNDIHAKHRNIVKLVDKTIGGLQKELLGSGT